MTNLAAGAALALLGLASCASGGAVRSGSSGPGSSITPTSTGLIVQLAEDDAGVSGLVEADADRVWSVLPEAYGALGISGGVVDAGGMVWGNTRFTGSRIADRRVERYVRCAAGGSGPGSTGSYRTRLSITSRVTAQADGRSLLTTTVTGSATTVEGTSTAASRCVSTGALEELIAGTAGALLAGG